MPEIIIRNAKPNDAALLADIIRRSCKDVAVQFNLTTGNAPTHPSNCTSQWIETALEKGISYYILENNQEPRGCTALEKAGDDVCYLERLSVLPEFRKQGFGRLLVNHALKHAEEKSAKRVEIGIIAEHIILRDWYLKLGFYEKNTKIFKHLPFNVTFMFKEIMPE